MLYAARLLRRGTDLESVADVTGVPVPLLELIQAESLPDATPGVPTARTVDSGRSPARRVSLQLMRTVVVLASVNLVLGLIAMVTGSTAVSTATGALAVVLLVIVVAVARRSPASPG